MLEVEFELRCELEEVRDEPEEVGRVDLDVDVREELAVEVLHQDTVTFEEEVHRELLEDVGDVLVGREVVEQPFHVNSNKEAPF